MPHGAPAIADGHGYRRPPPAILRILDAPPTPAIVMSPAHDGLLLVQGERYPAIADLAAPILRLAGLRIDPRTNGPHLPPRTIGLTAISLRDDSRRPIQLPVNGHFGMPVFAPTGRQFALANTTPTGIEVWIGDSSTASVRRIPGVRLSAAYGVPAQWRPDGKTLLCQLVPADRGEPPPPPASPDGPIVQESHGQAGPARTYADLLCDRHDENLLDFYATCQLCGVDPRNDRVWPIGPPGIFAGVESSPDGRYWLVERIGRPFSYLYPISSFPHSIEVWTAIGEFVAEIARLPLQDRVPIEGVPTGPRGATWALPHPARLIWVEALDGGDPRAPAAHRDAIMALDAPFDAAPREVVRLEHRFAGMHFDETGRWFFARDYDRERRWTTTTVIDSQSSSVRRIWDRSVHDRYGDPGFALQRLLPNGRRAWICSDGALALVGAGASPDGDRPFLDRFHLESLRSERLFQSGDDEYEAPIGLADRAGTQFLTRHESSSLPPNYRLRRLNETGFRALTTLDDPAPELREIRKSLVTYTRPDGVALSFTLYLPPGHREGERRPTVLWAYPQEFNTSDVAGQVAGTPHRFTTLAGPSHLFFLLAGYAVLDGATMPVVGSPETANDTFIEQIVASARAAIDKAVDLGATDPDRVGVGGHSYGAFMAANLLAHSRLFRAGIARSGAFNRTLTPFGFQNERRTLWEAGDAYARLSPFLYAHRIQAPLLLIHGEADNNPGTLPMQSKRMFQAVRGTGGRVRYVVLPHESHAYLARESVEHTLCEMIEWFDRYVKV